MQTETLLYIIASGIIALLLALFQYWFKSKSKSRLNMLFTFLRFLTVFSVLLLLVNPKFEQKNIYSEKPNLVVAIDNSSSVTHLGHSDKVQNAVESLINNEAINQKFNTSFYTFGNDLSTTDSIVFNQKQTNLDKAFTELSQIYKHTNSPTILITDGNQTFGNDYELSSNKYKQPIYPIILGDTINYTDLKIQQLNVNKYAYLKNRFPVEVIAVYNGNNPVISKFEITSGNTTIYSENVSFTKNNNSKIINFTLPANRVGVHSYKASIVPLDTERNKINNAKNFAVEVIDQKTNVALVSTISHPDLGALKKSIESNEQRSVSFVSPAEALNKINDYQLFILYQPVQAFSELFKALDTQNKNRFIIAGTHTNWRFLNQVQQNYTQSITNQTEDYQAVLNVNYATFIVDNLDFESFPPLQTSFGDVTFTTPIETLLYKKIGSIATENPLLATFETNGRREAVLFGEGIWKWRAQSFINSQSFNTFDNFTAKLVQYLASNKRKSRISLDHESFYNGNTSIIIKAQYFNKNYEFDARESLQITVKNNASETLTTFPFILKSNHYQVNLSSLPAGIYSYTVKTNSENISKSGNFTILEFSIEQQFLNANVTKLQQLATNSKGASYFIGKYEALTKNLLTDERYKAIQKSTTNTIPLIDWKYLLALIILSLALEWFIRKYNGLI